MQTKKRNMKAGEALVGMKRSGSQLERKWSVLGFVRVQGLVDLGIPSETEHVGLWEA